MFHSWHREDSNGHFRASRRRDRRPNRRRVNRLGLGLDTLESRVVSSASRALCQLRATAATISSLAVGDFNGDGKADIVTANNSPGTVNVLLNNGDGTFGAPIVTHTGNNPVEVEVADFNGDGKEDIVALGSYYLSAMTVMMGNGDGTFQPPVAYPQANPPTEIQVEDMNGDGHPDIVMDNEFFNSTSVLMNNGDGTFGPKFDTPVGSFPTSEAIGDFNNDGKPDLVVASSGVSAVTVLKGNGDGTFQPGASFATAGVPSALTVGDFNKDGKLDIATANSGSGNSEHSPRQRRRCTFGAPAIYLQAAASLDIEAADINGDGILDLVERTPAGGYAVELGVGDGSFYAATETSAPGASETAIGDFNGDGTPDIVTTSSAGGVSVLLNSGDPATLNAGAVGFVISTPATSIAGAPVPVTVTAVDANGNPVTGFLDTVGITTNDPQANGAVTSYTFTAADAGTHTFAAGGEAIHRGRRDGDGQRPAHDRSQPVGDGFLIAGHPPGRCGPGFHRRGGFGDVHGDRPRRLRQHCHGVHQHGSVHQHRQPGHVARRDHVHHRRRRREDRHGRAQERRASGGQRLTAIDTALATITGTSAPTTVTPAAASSLSLSGGGGFIGSPHAITVTAKDPFGNVATGDNGTVHITASDPQAILPADGALANGVGTFLWTPMTLGSMSITAADTANPAVTGTESGVVVTPGAATRFVVTPVAATTAGTTQSFTVTGYDVFGNVANQYTGTLVFSSSDPQASLPAPYTFTAADAGAHTFTVTMRTAGSQTLNDRRQREPLAWVEPVRDRRQRRPGQFVLGHVHHAFEHDGRHGHPDHGHAPRSLRQPRHRLPGHGHLRQQRHPGRTSSGLHLHRGRWGYPHLQRRLQDGRRPDVDRAGCREPLLH